jgi:hypothetical protein
MRTVLMRTGIGFVVVFGLIQLVPYGRDHSNPPVTQAAQWPDAASEELARGACYDCHSNETEWPAYSYVAPMSWLVRRDVDQGREKLNLSELDQDGGGSLDEAAEAISEGSMPPRQFRLLHPDARLSDAEQQALVDAFDELSAQQGDGDHRGKGGGEDD